MEHVEVLRIFPMLKWMLFFSPSAYYVIGMWLPLEIWLLMGVTECFQAYHLESGWLSNEIWRSSDFGRAWLSHWCIALRSEFGFAWELIGNMKFRRYWTGWLRTNEWTMGMKRRDG